MLIAAGFGNEGVPAVDGSRTFRILNYVLQTKIAEKRRGSVRSAEKKGKCLKEAARGIYPRREMEQLLSGMVGASKRAAQERVFLLLRYDSLAR